MPSKYTQTRALRIAKDASMLNDNTLQFGSWKSSEMSTKNRTTEPNTKSALTNKRMEHTHIDRYHTQKLKNKNKIQNVQETTATYQISIRYQIETNLIDLKQCGNTILC